MMTNFEKIKMSKVKHCPPTICKLRKKALGMSPSAALGGCLIGCKWRIKKCKDCKCNAEELIEEGFNEGIKRWLERKVEENG